MMKRQRLFVAIIAGVASLIVLGVLGVGLTRSGQAQDEPLPPPLVEYPDVPPTPTLAPRPPDPARPAANMLFADSFDAVRSLDDWTIIELEETIPGEQSVWTVEDGSLVQDRTAAAGNPSVRGTAAVTGPASWTDYTITAKVYDQNNGTFGLIARRQGNSFYRYRLIANEFEDTPRQVLEKVVDGVATPLAEVETPGYDQLTWHVVSLRVVGSTIQASLDGKVVAEATDAALSSGQAGLYTVAVGGILFDDVTVTAP